MIGWWAWGCFYVRKTFSITSYCTEFGSSNLNGVICMHIRVQNCTNCDPVPAVGGAHNSIFLTLAHNLSILNIWSKFVHNFLIVLHISEETTTRPNTAFPPTFCLRNKSLTGVRQCGLGCENLITACPSPINCRPRKFHPYRYLEHDDMSR